MNAAIALILLFAAGLGLAEAAALRGARRLVGVLAALAAPALLYFALFPPLHDAAGRPLRVLTAGATPEQRTAAPAGLRRVALPGAEAAGAERIADLATALRRHPDTTALQIVGGGLGPADRDAAAGRALSFEPAPLPRGIVELQLPTDLRAGQRVELAGRVQAGQGLQLFLRDPGGARQGPLILAADGRFRFSLTPPRAAQVDYTLLLQDGEGRVVEELAVPLDVRAGAALRLLLLSGGPDPDLKYLQRWALDAGHTVDARISLSRGLAQQRGTPDLSAAALAAFDLAIVDERAWDQLDAAARERLLTAVDEGLGLLLRLRAAPSPALVTQWEGLGIDFTPETMDTTLHIAGEAREGATAALRRLALASRRTGIVALASAEDGHAFAVARNRGRGRLGAWWLIDSHTLALSGQAERHAALWAQALDRLARPRQAVAPELPATPWQDQRASICTTADTADVVAADGTVTPLLLRGTAGARRCAGFWPREAGWHHLRSGDTQWSFAVRAADTATALQAAQTAAATQALVGPAADASALRMPGPRWPWFLAWLASTALLWWLSRAQRGVRVG